MIGEAQLLKQVRQAARHGGWLCYHTYDSRLSEPGFPDLVLVRPPELLFVELKSDRGRIRPEQREWIDALREAGQTAWVVRGPDETQTLCERLMTR